MFAEGIPSIHSVTGNSDSFANLSVIQNRIKIFLFDSLPVIREQLNEAISRNERSLSSEVCIRLNSAAEGQLFGFQNEVPQNLGSTRVMDIEALPRKPDTVYCGTRALDVVDPLYDIEVKLLPTPNGNIKKDDRSREYVVGSWNRINESKKTHKGGIERFKEEHHSPNLNQAALLALVKREPIENWANVVNSWIQELIDMPSVPSHKSRWIDSDIITFVQSNRVIYEYEARHSRVNKGDIVLQHLFLDLQDSH